MSLKHLTYKQRNVALGVATVFLCVVGYWAAFGKTFDLWQENRLLQSQMQLTENIDEQIMHLQKNLVQLKQYYAPTKGKDFSHHEELLRQVSGFCQENNLLIREFPPASFFEETQYLIEANEVIVEGDFKNIVKLIYNLEQVSKTGRVVSVAFEAGPDRKTRKYRLAAHIIIQNIKPIANES